MWLPWELVPNVLEEAEWVIKVGYTCKAWPKPHLGHWWCTIVHYMKLLKRGLFPSGWDDHHIHVGWGIQDSSVVHIHICTWVERNDVDQVPLLKKKMYAGAKMRIWTMADLQTESPMSINQINQWFQICWPLNNNYIIIHCCLTACTPCLFE